MSDIVLGPHRLAEGVLALHTPHPGDAEAWSRARLANRPWLERAFPAWGDDWASEQTPISWMERTRRQRRARAHGVASFVVRLDGRIIGEIGVDAIDPESATGEGSVWAVRDHGAAAMGVASVLLMQHVFTREHPLARVLSPVSVAAREGRRGGLVDLGFRLGPAVPRRVGDRIIEHDYWVLENTEEIRARLEANLAAVPLAHDVEILDRSTAGQTMRWKARASLRRARARLRDMRRNARSVPAPLVLAGAGTTSELAVTPVLYRAQRWLSAADQPTPDPVVSITRGDAVVATAGLRHDPGTGALRATLVGSVAAHDVPTFLDAVEAAAVAWWPESVSLEWKHPSTDQPVVEAVRSRGYVAALDEGVTTLWVRSRVRPD